MTTDLSTMAPPTLLGRPTRKTKGGKAKSKVERLAHLTWQPLAAMAINPLAQRDLKDARVDKIVAEFDLEQLGTPTVNEVGAVVHIIDGQHRIEALKKWFGDGNWEDQQIQCWTYNGLTEAEEAEVFLKLNDQLSVNAFTKFRVGVNAGRPEESEVDSVVRANGLRVSQTRSGGAICAVGTLMRVYHRAGANTLGRALRIVRDAYGDAGMEATVIDGIALLVQRYGELDDIELTNKLGAVRAGVNGLLGKAENLRRQTGNPKAHSIAAAAVEINNSGRGGKRLPSWWRVAD